MRASERPSIELISRSQLPRARLVVEHALHGTAYLDGALEALDAAVRAPGADGRALASTHDGEMEGVIVFGFFGGAHGAGRLQLAAVEGGSRCKHVGRALVDAAITLLRAEGARFVLAELPDDERALPGARAFVEALGFRAESRIQDFYRDGIGLSFMRRELDAR